MKAGVILLLTLCCFSISCSKTSFNISKRDITGTWKLAVTSGGIAGMIIYPTDNRTITFESSGKYSSSVNDTVVASGSYSFSSAGDPNYYNSNTLLNLNANGNKLTYGIALINDSLSLDEGCCDRFSYLYVKQK